MNNPGEHTDAVQGMEEGGKVRTLQTEVSAEWRSSTASSVKQLNAHYIPTLC